jgi:hypothetical protein
MDSLTSSSPSDPTLSLVIGSNGAPRGVEACLLALEPQRADVEVLVCEPHSSGRDMRERFPWARFIELPGASVPALWSEGIANSSGEIVALTISPMLPAPNWVSVIRDEHRDHDAVAGAIDPGPNLRIRDWAEYFSRYAPDMLPFAAHECAALPGDNSAYKRKLLDRTADIWRDGFWEPLVNRRLAQDGVELWHSPALIVQQGRSAGARAFLRQRLLHGRAHGRQRGARFGRLRNLAGVAGAPLVPALLTARVLQQVYGRRRHRRRALLALPLMFAFDLAWALGEALGHLDALRAA